MSVGSKIREALRTVPMRFQIRGVRFVEARGGCAIIGDSMGLGKTYQGIAFVAIHSDISLTVVICPATLKWQWQKQFLEHSGKTAQVLEAYKEWGLKCLLWKRDKTQGNPRKLGRWYRTKVEREKFIKTNARRICVTEKITNQTPRPAITEKIVIINYEILEDWSEVLKAQGIDLLLLDEFHYIKNLSAQRTKMCRKLAKKCKYKLGLSGTPITIRPVEFFPILNIVAPALFPSYWDYAFRYCDPKRGFRGRGWEFNGATNLEELHEKVSEVMIRRQKSEVLKDLPEKIRTIIPVDITNRKEYLKAEDDFIAWLEESKGTKAAKRASGAIALVKLGHLKRLAAEGKLRQAYQWTEDLLSTGEKLVIFLTHKVLMKKLKDKYPNAARIDGTVSQKNRHKEVERFARDPNCRIFLGQMKAAGVGVDGLHKAASNMLFLEMGWTPADHEQAEDRLLRIGSFGNSVNIYYMVATDTVEEKILGKIEERYDVVSRVLDGNVKKILSLLPSRRRHE